ncbi:chromosome-associated kinesin KIF4A [Lingula anatina]|uniref:Chromosome-associated kinesin KIF4A n=1 Tax=Lingula anatina TaxID=7574 RepID=A0A1S3KAT7_LINAN|nr:chromosome-associated kinesin KIF4A [Lingula anatina]|eukprot:XP_013419740.1 chromosome-associated kinesin KIF4A [Lingula anatina]
MSQDKVIPVKVALRARPLIPRETSEGCQQCLEFIPGEPQVVIGTKSFTYDFAFSPNTSQELVYDRAVANLVKGVFKGYNATVLAYGQTGSGKTYTMGSGYNISLEEDEDLAGVIPRVVRQLYRGIQEREESHTFVVRVSFLEIYNEDLHDLLSSNSSKDLAIREDPEGGILIPGLTETVVSSPEDTILCLEHGSTHRTTGATAMNATSSRSHAIFTIMVEQQSREDSNDFMKSKFHLVDLAGSERCKRTQAEGGRFKEGVNINLGLLALGNVISALGDESQKRSHIPYRDSKLTRLLQDSLGGNSHTVMIACVSPSDSNMEETLNTLRYADRARKIKNKPIVNRDPQAAEILRLKGVVQQLQVQLMQNGGVPGKFEGSIDIKALKERIKELEEENHKLSKELESAVDNSTGLCEKIIKTELARDRLKERLRDLRQQAGLTLNITQELEISGELKDKVDAMKDLSRKIQEFPEEEHELSTIEEETKTESSGSSPVPDEFDAKHALCQAKLSKELQELNRLINLKQDLASQLSENDGRLDNMRVEYEKNVKELESQLENLMKEKEQLQAALDSAKAQTNANKISEQRRQRLKELEKELAAKKKELLEKNKIVKMKESTDKQVTKMNTDIQTMKQQRVKLMKQMKEEADNFRKWKQSKEKEVMQLKAKDRKREYEMTKMARNHEKQQGVLKRKAEEAAAANKRLKEVLEKRKAVAAERSKCPENERNRYQLQVKSLLNQDLEIAVSLREAQHHLQSLMNDRKELTKQLSDLKDKLLNGPPKKKYAWGGAGDTKESSDEDKEEIKKQIRTLEQDLELRNAQIADLQQKIVDAEDGFRSKNLESIVSLGQAKTGMNYLLDQAVIAKCAQSRVACELRHQRNTVEDLTKQTEKMEEELKSVRHIHQEELLAQQRQYEDRAAAANKRLKEVLEKRKAVAAERSKCPENERNRYQLQVKSLLNQDLEIAVSLKEAQHHLQSLMNDRKELTKQLSDLKDKLLNGPPKKKYAWGGAGDTKESSDEDKEEIKKQIRTLEQDLELRNAQIADLQQKIVDAEDGFRSKNLESIVSLGQAKTGMNYLLDQAVIAKCAQSRVACELRHQRNTVEDLTKQTEKMEEELKSVRHIHQEELLAQQRQYEDRILYLLRQLKTKKEDEPLLNSTLDEQTKERLKFQEQEIERLSGLHEELQKKMEECEVLKKELTLAKYQGRKMSLMPTITRADGSPYFTPPNPLLRKKKPKSQRTEAELMLDFDDFSDTDSDDFIKKKPKSQRTEAELMLDFDDFSDTDSDDFIADDKNDKDWTKTPLYKTKNQRRKTYSEISKDSDKSSSGPGGGKFCSCKGNCQTKRCCCRKSLGLCVDSCGCNPDTCVNREGNSENVSQTSSGGLNTTFNVGLDQSGPGSADSTFNANTSVGRATRKALAAMNASQEEKPRRTRKSRESTKRPSASSLYKLESENSEGKAEDEDSDPITDLGQGGLKKKRRLLKQENSSFFPSITDEA